MEQTDQRASTPQGETALPLHNKYLLKDLLEVKDRAGNVISTLRPMRLHAIRLALKLFIQEQLITCLADLPKHPAKLPKKVFISYAWAKEGSPTYYQDKLYETYVEKLAKDLQRIGCEVYLDRWYDQVGKPLTEFVELMDHADCFIAVGSYLYLVKYQKRAHLANEREHVVRAEGEILDYIATYSSKWRHKIMPVLLEGTPEETLPLLLRPNIPLQLHHEDYFEEFFKLVKSIYSINNQDKAFKKLTQRFFKTLEDLTKKSEENLQAYILTTKQVISEILTKNEADKKLVNFHSNPQQLSIVSSQTKALPIQTSVQNAYQMHTVPGVHYFQGSQNKAPQPHLNNSPTLHGAKVYNLPVKNPNFTGRRELLAKIDHCLKSSSQTPQVPLKPVVLTACYGLGGIGKTQLATEYVYQHLADYSAILWMDAENAAQIETAFHQLASQWQIAVESPQTVIEAVKRWLENHPGYLLVLDNVAAYEAIEPYLPHLNGQVLITSRHIQWPGTSIAVDVFSSKEAQAYVKQLLPHSQDQKESVALLIKTLGYLPLALAQACAFIKENHLPLETYLRLYEKKRAAFFKANVLPKGDKHLPVYVNWDMTLQVLPVQLDKWQLPAAIGEQLLTFCAYLQHTGIPTTLLRQYLESQGIKEELKHYQVIGLLRNYSLLLEDQVAACCAIHPVMQEVLKLKASTKAQAAHLIAVYTCLKQLYPYRIDNTQAIGLKRQLLPHLAQLLKQWDQDANLKTKKDELRWLLIISADAYTTFGDAKRSKELLERLLAIEESHFGKDHWKVAITLDNLGKAYGALGDAAQQKVLLERALAIKESHFGKDHWQVARTLDNLAPAYGALGDATQQKLLSERALTIKEKYFDKDDWQLAITLNNLGNAYGALGNAAQQKALLKRSLVLEERHYGKEHCQVARTLNNLGNAYGALGNPTKKKVLLKRALPILEKHYGKDHWQVALTLVSLANAYGALGNVTRLKALLKRALALEESYYGQDHLVLAFTIHNFGMIYFQLNKWSKSKVYFLRALEIFQINSKLKHIDVVTTLIGLSIVEQKQQHSLKAQAYLKQALAIPMRAYDLEIQAIQHTWAKLQATYGFDISLVSLPFEVVLEKVLSVMETLYQVHATKHEVLRTLTLFQLLLQDKDRFVAFIGLSSEQVALESTATDFSYSPRP